MCLGDVQPLHRIDGEALGGFISPGRSSPIGLSDQCFMPSMHLVATDPEALERGLDPTEDASERLTVVHDGHNLRRTSERTVVMAEEDLTVFKGDKVLRETSKKHSDPADLKLARTIAEKKQKAEDVRKQRGESETRRRRATALPTSENKLKFVASIMLPESVL